MAKVEGHANLTLKIDNGKVVKCELNVIEGARLFEELLKGRNCNDVQEIVSRICGICSCAHT
ncbi:MAG: nickel-dependent hydrogenase large subunit, partial [archaeon]